ncbi:MAG: T9SS type A sorting domain-containing protein [Cytophagaceae bacterium]|nr:T9SS type A sorting domain-containing protein [Cytophagaceae bacterium]
MKTKYPIILWAGIIYLSLFTINAHSQTCQLPTSGQNMIPNGNFSQGNTGFVNDYVNHATAPDVLGNCPGCYRNWSNPDEYMVTDIPADFHFQFLNVTDVSPTADNNFLMVDGSCTAGKDAWRTNVNVVNGVSYYFEAYLTTLASSASVPAANVATVRFLINGVQLGANMVAPTATGSWLKFTQNWTSTTTGSVTITIENLSTGSCGSGNDYGLDDISFTPGCQQGSAGPVPNLGADRTICGTGGTINLPANAPGATRYLWSTGATTSSINITTAGTYSVCVDNGTSCPQADQIVISNTYSFDLGGPYTLCNPISITLDAQHSGTGVTYRWYKESNGTAGWQTADTLPGPASRAKTYTANSAGTYRVVVTDPSCMPAQEDQVTITNLATATPVDVHFCPPNKNVTLSVIGSGTYDWYAAPIGGAVLAGGSNTSSYTTVPISATTTYYVEDSRVYNTSVGSNALNEAARNQTQLTDKYMVFEAKQALTIDSVTVYFWLNNNNANDPISIQFRLFDNPSNYNTPPATIATGPAFSMTNTTANAAGLITPAWGTKPDGVYAVRVPVKLNVAAAGMYRLGVASQNPTNTQIQTSGGAYLYNDAATAGNVITINQSKLGNNPPTATEYHGMFRWKILYNSSCGRTPVRAIADCVLPVELLSFTAFPLPTYNAVYWSTGSEENSSFFEVQKSSDGINFESIGKIQAMGNSSSLAEYTFKDANISGSITYYRLVQHDMDGKKYYSEAISIKRDGEAEINIYPNPAHDKFSISINGLKSSSVKIAVLNSVGQALYSQSIPAGGELFEKELSAAGLAPGIYFINVITEESSYLKKLVVE